MSAGQHGLDPMAYKPTSLDFINRPNPVEPHTAPEKHPLNDTPRVEKTAQQDLLRLLINSSANVERPAKRRKSVEGKKLLDLPKLPTVRNGTRRLRIPPTLSGLHQPPPDAGLLPSMSVNQPIKVANKPAPLEPNVVAKPKISSATADSGAKSKDDVPMGQLSTPSKPKRNKWSDDETTFLLKGVARFGIGNWTQILKCSEYHFERRTAIDLKDRFRVCCPDHYRTTRKPKVIKISKDQTCVAQQRSNETSTTAVLSRSDRKSSAELLKLGIDQPFEKSRRRKRTQYTAAEDDALLKGFEKHGNSWTAIREDEELGLENRTATDLRDRFRTKHPERYEKTGLAPRPEVFPKKPDREMKEDNATHNDEDHIEHPKEIYVDSEVSSRICETSRTGKESKGPHSTLPSKKQHATSLLHYDDVFWGAPFDVDETETERITLDRRILDWPSDLARVGRGSIDPLAILNLPRRPIAITHMNITAAQNAGTGATLPSLAAITAGSDDFADQLELPSLMGTFGALDGDGRTGTHFPSLDELLR